MNTLPLTLTRVVTELAGVNTLHTLVWVYLHKLADADHTSVCLLLKGRNNRSGCGGNKCVWTDEWSGRLLVMESQQGEDFDSIGRK